MNALKKIGLALLAILALGLIAAAVMKKDYMVERSTIINRGKLQVFDYLRSLQRQDEWSPWNKRDPNMKKEFIGTDGTVGCISKWSGNKDVGVGEQEMKKITEGERIDLELRFKEPWESTSPAWLITESSSENSTTVKWGMSGVMPFPMNIMLPFMKIEEMVGKDFDEGLATLKTKLEQMPEPVIPAADSSAVN